MTDAATGQPDLAPAEELDLSEASILLVDDNEQNLELMQAYLDDTRRTRLMLADGSYLRMSTDDDAFDVHEHLMARK